MTTTPHSHRINPPHWFTLFFEVWNASRHTADGTQFCGERHSAGRRSRLVGPQQRDSPTHEVPKCVWHRGLHQPAHCQNSRGRWWVMVVKSHCVWGTLHWRNIGNSGRVKLSLCSVFCFLQSQRPCCTTGVCYTINPLHKMINVYTSHPSQFFWYSWNFKTRCWFCS